MRFFVMFVTAVCVLFLIKHYLFLYILYCKVNFFLFILVIKLVVVVVVNNDTLSQSSRVSVMAYESMMAKFLK